MFDSLLKFGTLLFACTVQAATVYETTGRGDSTLLDWLQENGGVVNGVEVGQVTGDSPRGLVATRTLDVGEVVLAVPLHCALNLGQNMSAAQAAPLLLREKHRAKSRLREYIMSLPRVGDLHTQETLLDSEVALLQSPILRELVERRRAHTHEMWMRTTDGGLPAEFFSGAAVPLQEFRWATAIVHSRWLPGKKDGKDIRMLVPGVDMANHDTAAPQNLRLQDGMYELVIESTVQMGQEVRMNYGSHIRNDQAAMRFGFLLPDEPPALFEVDRPQVVALYKSVQKKTQAADSLQQVLYDHPTTVLEDVTLLQQRAEAAAGLRLVTATNIARKRALANEILLLGGEVDAAFWPPCLSEVCGNGVNHLLDPKNVENTETCAEDLLQQRKASEGNHHTYVENIKVDF